MKKLITATALLITILAFSQDIQKESENVKTNGGICF